MKYDDWNGQKIPVTVRAIDLKHGLGEKFDIKARFQEEAEAKALKILEQHHGDFLRASQGEYQLKFDRV